MIERTPLAQASPAGDLQAEIVRALSDTIKTLGLNDAGLDFTLRPIPLEGAWGFGSAVAFQLKRNGAPGAPQEIAERVAAGVPPIPQLERVEAVSGYINFYADKNWYANRVVGQALSQEADYGCWPPKNERVMVEFANMNTHKAMHVGHLRNVVLGAAALNILKCYGYDTVSATYMGDIGLHVIRTLWALRFHKDEQPPADPDKRGQWLENLYVEATGKLEYRDDVAGLIADSAKADPAIAAQLTIALQAITDNDPGDAETARHISDTLLSREGPGWEQVLSQRAHIVLNLWAVLGRALVAQPSTLEPTNRDAAAVQPAEPLMDGLLVDGQTGDGGTPAPEPEADPLAALRADYERLDSHMEWWDQVPGWQAEVKALFARWDAQDPEITALWQQTREWSLEMFRRIFRDLHVHFDVWFFESEVEHPGKEVVDELIAKGIAEDLRPEGPVVVRIDDQLRAHPDLSRKYQKDLFKTNKDGTTTPKEAWRTAVVLRSDGTSLYSTKDLELARRKFNDWHIDRSIYVIDTRQSLYFQQIYKILELWGFPQAENCYHLAYEFVNTPEGAISSRKGGAPNYEEFETEAIARARAIVERKEAEGGRGLNEGQKEAIAKAVAYGALKMGMLDKDNNKIITFVWEQALNPETQSATYVQYSHARATRVLEKAPAGLLPKPGETFDFSEQTLFETNLLELIAKLPEEVGRAAEAHKPVIIATYCFELADAFNNFYHNCPILRAGADERVQARLALTAAARQTMANALGLLGIEAPEIM